MIPKVGPDTTADEVVGHLQDAGCVIVESLASDEVMDRNGAELEPALAETGTNNTKFSGLRTKRFNGVLSRVPASHELALQPLVLEVAGQMLLPYCTNFQLNYEGIMHLMPGESAQKLHRDSFIYPIRQPAPANTIATMWAASDFTAENGGTLIVPGSHRWDHDHHPAPGQAISTEMPRGSVVIYQSGIFHGAGPNVSDAPRSGIALHYNFAWLRQELNMYLMYPPDVARTFSPKLQRLIGYDFAGPYLGFIDGGSPQQLLDDRRTSETRERTTPQLDEAYEALEPIRFGP